VKGEKIKTFRSEIGCSHGTCEGEKVNLLKILYYRDD